MLRLSLLFGLCLCVSLVAARRGLDLSQRRRIFNRALSEDQLRQTKKLRSCWFDEGGNCCKNNVQGCSHYKSKSKQRGTSINVYYMPFYYGNFQYQNCNVQCWCTSYQATCATYTQAPAAAPTAAVTTVAAVVTTTAAVTTTTAAVTTTTAATTTTTAATTTTTTAATTTTTAATTTTTAATTTTTAATTTTTAATTTAATTTAATTTAATTTAATTAAATTAVTRNTEFCPATATTKSRFSRLLNGQDLTTCNRYPGVVTIFSPATNRVLCSGVVVSNKEVAIPNNCAKKITTKVQILEPAIRGRSKPIQEYGPIRVNQIPTGGKFVIRLDVTISKSSCPGIACIYDDRMRSSIDISSCRVVADGYKGKNGVTASLGFINVGQFEDTDTCRGKLSGSNLLNKDDYTYNCFNGTGQSTCEGDTGGAVMCKLSSDETVVIGQIETSPCNGRAYVGFYNLDSDTIRVMKSKGSPILLGISRKNRKDISLGNRGDRRNSLGGIVLGLSKKNRGIKINKANRGLNLGLKNGKKRVQLGLSSKDKKVRLRKGNQVRELNLGKVNKGLRLGKKREVKLGLSGSRGIRIGKSKSTRGINLSKKRQTKKVRLGKNKGQRSVGGKLIQLGVGAKKSLRLGEKKTNRKINLKSKKAGVRLGATRDKKRVKLGLGKTVKKVPRTSGISLGASDNKQRANIDLRAKAKTTGLNLG